MNIKSVGRLVLGLFVLLGTIAYGAPSNGMTPSKTGDKKEEKRMPDTSTTSNGASDFKTKVRSVQLVKGDRTPSTVFESDDIIYVMMTGDFAKGTQLALFWGETTELSQILTLTESKKNNMIAPYFQPKAGWTKGKHKMILFVDKQQIGEYPFEVK